jgi:hypothetical protein
MYDWGHKAWRRHPFGGGGAVYKLHPVINPSLKAPGLINSGWWGFGEIHITTHLSPALPSTQQAGVCVGWQGVCEAINPCADVQVVISWFRQSLLSSKFATLYRYASASPSTSIGAQGTCVMIGCFAGMVTLAQLSLNDLRVLEVGSIAWYIGRYVHGGGTVPLGC